MMVDCFSVETEKMAPPLKFLKEVDDITTSSLFTKMHPAVTLCSFPMNSQLMMLTYVPGRATRLGTL